MISPTAEDYLVAIYRLEETSCDPVVPLSDLADRLQVSVVSVNQTVRRLEDLDLLVYTPYRGASLSESGRARAMGVLRRHRLWERFLADKLGMPWEQVHEEACRLEHVTSDRVEERLAEFLGEPGTCPHGHPVPDEASNSPVWDGQMLDEVELGNAVRILSVEKEEPELLRYLAEVGLSPGQEVELVDRNPAAGVLRIKVGDTELVVSREVGRQVRVQRLHTVE
jgi:DtxR family Mn-dependent transcriptional regulator